MIGDLEEELDPISETSKEIMHQHVHIIHIEFQQDIRSFLSITDLFVLPSYREGLPNVLIEAGSYGIPLLATNINGCNEVIIHEKNGLLIAPKNEVALQNGIEKFLTDKDFYQKVKKSAREYCQSLCTALFLGCTSRRICKTRTRGQFMKVLLTGARGFIGSYFQQQYAQKYTIQPFSFLNNDLETLQLKDVDVVIHLSALVHQMNGASDKAYEKINVEQTLQLAHKAKENGVKHFIFMSTVKVYGEESTIAYTETSLCYPKDMYGKTKLKAEQELQKLENNDFRISIIRTPIVYGAGVKANMQNLMKLIDKMILLPFGHICNKRSFVYIGNLTALIDAIIEQGKSGVFLAGDDEALSTTELIQRIAQAKKRRIFLIKIPLFGIFLKWIKPSFYQRLFENLLVDNTKTKEALHFKNPYSIKEGIVFMVQGSSL